MELHVGGFYHPPPFTTSYMRSLVYMLGLEEEIVGFYNVAMFVPPEGHNGDCCPVPNGNCCPRP